MGILIDSADAQTGDATITLDIGDADRNRVVIIQLGDESIGTDDAAAGTVTVDGKSATLRLAKTNPSGAGNRQELWTIDEAALGSSSGEVDVAFTGLDSGWGVRVRLVTGLDSGTPTDTAFNDTAIAPTNPEISIDVPAGGMIFYGAGNASSGGTASWTAPLLELKDGNSDPPTGALLGYACGIENSAETAKTYTVTIGATLASTGLALAFAAAAVEPEEIDDKAPIVAATTSAADTDVDELVLNVPTGTEDGDTLLILGALRGSNADFGEIDGWDIFPGQLPFIRKGVVYRRIADNEPASYTVSIDQTDSFVLFMLRVTGGEKHFGHMIGPEINLFSNGWMTRPTFVKNTQFEHMLYICGFCSDDAMDPWAINSDGWPTTVGGYLDEDNVGLVWGSRVVRGKGVSTGTGLFVGQKNASTVRFAIGIAKEIPDIARKDVKAPIIIPDRSFYPEISDQFEFHNKDLIVNRADAFTENLNAFVVLDSYYLHDLAGIVPRSDIAVEGAALKLDQGGILLDGTDANRIRIDDENKPYELFPDGNSVASFMVVFSVPDAGDNLDHMLVHTETWNSFAAVNLYLDIGTDIKEFRDNQKHCIVCTINGLTGRSSLSIDGVFVGETTGTTGRASIVELNIEDDNDRLALRMSGTGGTSEGIGIGGRGDPTPTDDVMKGHVFAFAAWKNRELQIPEAVIMSGNPGKFLIPRGAV